MNLVVPSSLYCIHRSGTQQLASLGPALESTEDITKEYLKNVFLLEGKEAICVFEQNDKHIYVRVNPCSFHTFQEVFDRSKIQCKRVSQ